MPPRLIWRITRVYEHRFRVIPQQNQTPECGCISLTWWIRSYVSQVLTWGNWQSTINGTKVTCSRRSCLTKGRCMGSWLMLGWNNRNTVTHTHTLNAFGCPLDSTYTSLQFFQNATTGWAKALMGKVSPNRASKILQPHVESMATKHVSWIYTWHFEQYASIQTLG